MMFYKPHLLTEALIENFLALGDGGGHGVCGANAVLKGGDGHGRNFLFFHADLVQILGNAHVPAR